MKRWSPLVILTLLLTLALTVRITDVFKHHTEFFDGEMMRRLRQGNSPFSFDNLRIIQTTEEPKAIPLH